MQHIPLMTAKIMFFIIMCLLILTGIMVFALLVKNIIDDVLSNENSFIYRSFMFIVLFILLVVTFSFIIHLIHLLAPFVQFLS